MVSGSVLRRKFKKAKIRSFAVNDAIRELMHLPTEPLCHLSEDSTTKYETVNFMLMLSLAVQKSQTEAFFYCAHMRFRRRLVSAVLRGMKNTQLL